MAPGQDELALFVDSVTDHASFLIDPQGRIKSWNRGAQLLTGWDVDAILGRDFELLYPEQERERGTPAEDLARVERDGRIREETWRARSDGSEFLADVTLVALRHPDGGVRAFGQTLYDITDRKAAEAALARSELHLRSILATVPTR